MRPDGDPVQLAYITPGTTTSQPVPPPAAGQPRSTLPPDYAEITSGARVLSAVGMFLVVVGAIGIVIGLMIGLTMLTTAMKSTAVAMGPSGVVVIVGSMFYGVPVVLTGLVVRMLGAVALAVRDIARNSFPSA